jgi:uncharacterized membrane protein (UPF0127 family)
MSYPVRIINHTNNFIKPIHGRYCDDFISRLRGFTFRKNISIKEGLVLVEKRDSRMDTSIHMLFVWTDLAVIWVDSSFTVVHKTLAKSWRPFYASKTPSKFVIELHPSRLDDFQIGDTIEFENE